jgi:hypothetical protein
VRRTFQRSLRYLRVDDPHQPAGLAGEPPVPLEAVLSEVVRQRLMFWRIARTTALPGVNRFTGRLYAMNREGGTAGEAEFSAH